MSKEKFNHLKTSIDAKTIEGTPIHLLDEKKLPESKKHFAKIKENFSSDPEIVTAAENIISKIDHIINLGNKDFSGEIMQAANNPDYGKNIKFA